MVDRASKEPENISKTGARGGGGAGGTLRRGPGKEKKKRKGHYSGEFRGGGELSATGSQKELSANRELGQAWPKAERRPRRR